MASQPPVDEPDDRMDRLLPSVHAAWDVLHAAATAYWASDLPDNWQSLRAVRLSRQLFEQRHPSVDPDQLVIGSVDFRPLHIIDGVYPVSQHTRPAWTIYLTEAGQMLACVAQLDEDKA